jgi:serine/threonine-protein phosphatase Stp1
MTTLRGISACKSHLGTVRRLNEDSCLALPERGLWVVADGMGGHHAGDYASQMIVQALGSVGEYRSLGEFVGDVEARLLAVNDRLLDDTADLPPGTVIGSTVVALLTFNRQAAFLWAGDSRVYRLRGGELRQLTRDHSEIEELIASGEVTREAAEAHPSSNVITRAVGALPDEDAFGIGITDLRPDDRFLLCSDGLYRVVTDAEIQRHLAGFAPEEICHRLIELALARQCSDNVTVISVEFSAPA